MNICVKNQFLLPALIVGLGLIVAGRVSAQTFTTLHSFTSGDGADVVLSWSSSMMGWALQTNNNLATGIWGDYAGPVINNTATNSPAGNLFFRLTTHPRNAGSNTSCTRNRPRDASRPQVFLYDSGA